ncbi:MAG: PQQ-binding-like beta-propeller repeat protein, partial [Nitrospinota bacterium]
MSPEGMLSLPTEVERLPNGNTLITDGGDWWGAGSEVIEVDRLGQIVWVYAKGLKFAHAAKPLDSGNILITDTNNNRVIEVDRRGELVWSSEGWGRGTGRLSDGSQLYYPNDAEETPDGTLLITDRNNNRAVECDREGRVLWSYEGLKHPHNADRLPDGNTLLTSSDENLVLEVDKKGKVVWSYGGGGNESLNWPRDADRLPNGNTLITDSKNHRIFEVTREGRVVWSYTTELISQPYDADRLPNGNTLYSDQRRHQVVEIDALGNIIWSYRNFHRPAPIGPKVLNPGFEEEDPLTPGVPLGWIPCNLLSEGGGLFLWDAEIRHTGARSGGLVYDRKGTLWWQQTVQVRGGKVYRLSAFIKTDALDGYAQLQVAFIDKDTALLHDISALPGARPVKGTQEWTRTDLEMEAPARATAADIRCLVTGRGRAWFDDIEFFEIPWI